VWTFWYLKRDGAMQTLSNYEDSIKKIGDFQSVESFWKIYNHIIRPGDAPFSVDYFCFRDGVRPMWEDSENKNGGKFVLRAPKQRGKAARWWEDVLLAVLGGQFAVPSDEICGVIVSIRPGKEVFSIWTKRAGDEALKKIIYDTLKDIFGLPSHYSIDYRTHAESENQSIKGDEIVEPAT